MCEEKKNVDGENGIDYEDDEDGEDSDEERIWVDKKSQQTYKAYRGLIKMSMTLGENNKSKNVARYNAYIETFLKLCELYENAGEPIDKNTIFLEVAGGVDKRKRVYGVGSSQTLFYKPETIPSSSSADAENQKLQEELKIMKDKMKVMEDKIAKILKVTSAQVAQTPATNLDSENGGEDSENGGDQ
ncbi:hypothetical protein AgCh_018501 [Apium graveolens]